MENLISPAVPLGFLYHHAFEARDLNLILVFLLLQLVIHKGWALGAATCFSIGAVALMLFLGIWAPIALLLTVVLFGLSWLWFWLLLLTEESEWWWIVLFGGMAPMVCWVMYI